MAWKVEAGKPVGREHSLVREVVNREYAWRAAQDRVSLVQRFQIDRCEPRLPIMGVHDGRAHAGSRDELERGPDERSEPESVVRIVSRASAVQAVAIVELGNIDEQRARTVPKGLVEQADLSRPPAEEKGESLDLDTGGHTPISGQCHRDLPAQPRERGRQRAQDVGEPSRLGEGQRFGSDDEDRSRTAVTHPWTGRGHARKDCINRGYNPLVTERPPRAPRADPRDVAELKQLRADHPELASAVDMQLALVDMQRRVQARVPLPWIQPDPQWLADPTGGRTPRRALQ